MRVGLIVAVPAPAGTDLLSLHAANVEQARALGNAGVETTLYVNAQRGFRRDLNEHARLVGIEETQPAPIPGAALVRAALADGADVLQLFHMLDVRTLSFLTMKARGLRLFAEYNTGLVPRGLRAQVMQRCSRRLAGVFFTAREMAKPFVEGGALSPDTPVVAVPEIASLLVAPESTPRPDGPPRVLVVARAAPFKRPDVLLAAFRHLIELRPQVRFTWAMNEPGPLWSWLQHRVATTPGLARRIDFISNAPAARMTALYREHHVLMHASVREACGFAFTEAMQQGLPIAATAIAPFAALAPDGAAELVTADDAEALAGAADRLIDDPGARTRTRRRYVEALSWQRIGQRKAAVFAGQTVSPSY